MSNTVHAVGGIFTEGVVEATTQARCNKKMVQSGMTVSSNWEEVTCGRCLKMYVRHDGRKNSPLPVLEYVREELVGNGRTSEEMTEIRESLLHKGDRQYASPEQVTSLEQLEVGTVVEQKFYDWGKSTHWVITAIKTPPMSSGNIAVYANRVRKSDHKVIIRGSNGLPTYNTVIAWFITGELKKDAFTLTVIESKQVVEQPEEEERLSICCGADEDENIENMCSACHESTTFEVPHRNLDGSLGEMPPEPETVGFSSPISSPEEGFSKDAYDTVMKALNDAQKLLQSVEGMTSSSTNQGYINGLHYGNFLMQGIKNKVAQKYHNNPDMSVA